eukprot:1124446-Pleurochrysis_carterae.AAC.7
MEAGYNNNKDSSSQSTRLHREDRGREPSGARCRHALRGIKSRIRRNSEKMHKCQCQNMQMRMNDKQTRNLKF